MHICIAVCDSALCTLLLHILWVRHCRLQDLVHEELLKIAEAAAPKDLGRFPALQRRLAAAVLEYIQVKMPYGWHFAQQSLRMPWHGGCCCIHALSDDCCCSLRH